jgi:methylated-DNA-[protein]-cysteine S-methyltransferase
MQKLYFYQTELGQIGIAENGQAITNLYFPHEQIPANVTINETALLKNAGQQLQRYFAGRCKKFTLPLAPEGTEFMQRVWECLRAIPYGETRSYAEIARRIGNNKAYRAVGMANNRNPIPIIIPCHRVIGANGKLIGYGGGLEIKVYLLELEKRYRNHAIQSS